MKLVSIIIPTYNCARYLPETLESLVGQTYSDWEAICVDDGSTDNTLEVTKGMASIDSRIKSFSRSVLPKGGSHCRNIGLEYASGDYAIFLDGDDILSPECLEERVKAMDTSTYDFAIFSTGTIKDGVARNIITDSRIKDYKSAFASNHAVWQTTSPIYRMSFLRKFGGFDITFQRMQDLEFGLRAIVESKGNFKSYIGGSKPDCFYRLSDNAVTAKKYILGLQQFDKFVCLLHKLEDEGHFPDKRKLSTIYLSLALSSLIVYSRKGVYDEMSFNSVFTSYPITEKMNLKDKTVFRSVQLLSPFKKLQNYAARCLRRLLMNIHYR